MGPQSFSLAYGGRLAVAGRWESSRLVFLFGSSHADGLRRYCRLLEARGAIPRRSRPRDPAWWRRPIFCTWHEQCAVNHRQRAREALEQAGGTQEQCTQANCERWLRIILREKLPIGTFIIDAKWQRHYATNEPDPDRWPDLHGFIARCHRHGIKVVLWVDAWLRKRAALYRIAMPDKAIDTDGAFRFSLAEDPLDSWALPCELGTPTLYAIENHFHLRGFHPGVRRPFLSEEYARLRATMIDLGPTASGAAQKELRHAAAMEL